ncbi:hypothetical protein F5B20DRAFT_594508 [Whalleya microplaca]|nr:hypothetical protein F5B20DRAFT_594508 [Whalleya microplaca]
MPPSDLATPSLGHHHNHGRFHGSKGNQSIANSADKSHSRYRLGNEFDSYPLDSPTSYLGNNTSTTTKSTYTTPTDSPSDSPTVYSNGLDGSPVDEPNDSNDFPRHPMRYLPGCSGGKPKDDGQNQIVSNSMMQAYVKMRGPCMGDDDDPLFEWIRLREDLPLKKPPPSQRKDVSRMLELIDKALVSENMGGDSPRDAIFEIERPTIEHIEPPADMDLSIHALTACCADFEVEHDEDDEEGDVPSGRISPCTFLAWSRNCVRWDDNAGKVPLEDIAANERRRRPPTPEYPATPKDHFPTYYTKAETQYDQISGEEMSPYYIVPSSPSIIYTPPGLDPKIFPSAAFQEKYSRMLPLVARDLRNKQYGHPAVPASPTPASEHYSYVSPNPSPPPPPSLTPSRQPNPKPPSHYHTNTNTTNTPTPPPQSEVENVVDKMTYFGLGNLQGHELESHFAGQWQATAEAEAEESALYTEVQTQQTLISTLEAERAKLRLYLPALRQSRAQRRQLRDEKAREARIREHLATHARDVQYRFDLAYVKRAVQRRKRDWNAEYIETLRREIDDECLLVGKLAPQGVYDEVHGVAPKPEEEALARREWARREFGGEEEDCGGGKGKGKAKESPGSFGSWCTDL